MPQSMFQTLVRTLQQHMFPITHLLLERELLAPPSSTTTTSYNLLESTKQFPCIGWVVEEISSRCKRTRRSVPAKRQLPWSSKLYAPSKILHLTWFSSVYCCRYSSLLIAVLLPHSAETKHAARRHQVHCRVSSTRPMCALVHVCIKAIVCHCYAAYC